MSQACCRLISRPGIPGEGWEGVFAWHVHLDPPSPTLPEYGGRRKTTRCQFSEPRRFRTLFFRDRHAFQDIALLDQINDLHAPTHLAEDGVFAVEPVGDDVGDEELAAVGVGAGVGHREGADLVLVWGCLADFVGEFVARAAACRCRWGRRPGS